MFSAPQSQSPLDRLSQMMRRMILPARVERKQDAQWNHQHQTLQVTTLGETHDVPRVQEYGLYSIPVLENPHATPPVLAPTAIVVNLVANPEQMTVIAVDQPGDHPPGMGEGDVVVYNHAKVYLKLLATGDLEIAVPGKATLNVSGQADITVGGKATLTGNGGIDLKGAATGLPEGVVTQSCTCAFTGAPHPMASTTVKATP